MAKITAARKAIKKQNKGTLAKAAKSLASRGDKTAVAKLRKSITPGTVLILLAGQHKGKRVVFLKQLKSGLLLVSGLMKVNGVPLRRVDQRYVIATSTKVELSQAVLDAVAPADDVFFKKAAAYVVKQKQFIQADATKAFKVNEDRVTLQKAVDAVLHPVVAAKGDIFVKYLSSVFTLGSVAPHKLRF